MWSVFRTLFAMNPLYFVKVAFLFFIENLLEGFGLAMVAPIFYRMLGNSSGDTTFAWVDRLFLDLGLSNSIENLLLLMVLIFVVRAFLMYYSKKSVANSSAGILQGIQQNLLSNYLRSGLPFFQSAKSGDLVSSIVTEANRTSLSFLYLSQWISLLFSVALYAGLSLFVSFYLTLMAFVIGFVFFFPLRRITNECERIGGITTNLNSELQSDLSESFSMIKFIKAGHYEGFVQGRIFKKIQEYKQNWAETYFLSGAIQIFSNPIGVFILGTVLYMGHRMNIASPDLVVFLIAFQRLLPSYTSMQSTKNNLFVSYPGFQRVQQMMDKGQRFHEKTEGASVGTFTSLKMQDLEFSYGSDKKVLRDLNLQINKGQVTALVGLSGQGKTTLVDLIIGFYQAQKGLYEINSRPFHELSLARWREQISYVTQDTFLFHDTIRNNILFGQENISESELAHLIKICHAEFIYDLENGLETLVGDRGSKLSGGQRQRIALVRALVRKPSLLILDEATSSLDTQSEIMIKNTLESLKQQRDLTIVLIAHRLETVKVADQILVMNQGRIEEQGSWQDLAGNPQSFFHQNLSLRN